MTEPDTTGRRVTVGRALAGVVIVASFVFWIWAFTPFARRENPDRIDDRAWVTTTDIRCAEAQTVIDALPTARDASTPQQRADQVEQGTETVVSLVDDLRDSAATLPTTTDGNGLPDAELVTRWFADWDRYIEDRWAHVERLRQADESTSDRDLRFLVTDAIQGGVYTERMDGFARVNDMNNCTIPGDV